jgi:hypothetical protein
MWLEMLYTQVDRTMFKTFDPPQPPLKRGEKRRNMSGSPLFKGGRGDRMQGFNVLQTCVHTVGLETGKCLLNSRQILRRTILKLALKIRQN